MCIRDRTGLLRDLLSQKQLDSLDSNTVQNPKKQEDITSLLQPSKQVPVVRNFIGDQEQVPEIQLPESQTPEPQSPEPQSPELQISELLGLEAHSPATDSESQGLLIFSLT